MRSCISSCNASTDTQIHREREHCCDRLLNKSSRVCFVSGMYKRDLGKNVEIKLKRTRLTACTAAAAAAVRVDTDVFRKKKKMSVDHAAHTGVIISS